MGAKGWFEMERTPRLGFHPVVSSLVVPSLVVHFLNLCFLFCEIVIESTAEIKLSVYISYIS